MAGKKKSTDWESGAVKRPGRFTRLAKRAGMSVSSYARKEQGAKGLLGEEARFAHEMEEFHRK